MYYLIYINILFFFIDFFFFLLFFSNKRNYNIRKHFAEFIEKTKRKLLN